jgi:peptidoglycan/LPS O-acetylase OafA/YrhL
MLYLLIMSSMAVTSWLLVKFVLPSGLTDEKLPKYASLEGLRGFLASGVLISHAFLQREYYSSGIWSYDHLHSVAANMYHFAGSGSVAVFFMITGLLFWGKVIDQNIQPLSLFKSRVRRIMPLYWFGTLIIMALCFAATNFKLTVGLDELVIAIARWMAGGLLGSPPINGVGTLLINAGVTWTLQYEWIFYALLPILSRWHSLRAFCIMLMVYVAACVTIKLTPLHEWAALMLVALPFFGGMAAAYVTRYLPCHVPCNITRPVPRYFLTSIKQYPSAQSSVVVLSFLLGATLYKNGWATVVAALLVPAFFLIALGNNVFGLLETNWARWLGRISFSIYLLHGIVLYVSLKLINQISPIAQMSAAHYAVCCMLMSAGAVLVCSASYGLIERKFVQSRR